MRSLSQLVLSLLVIAIIFSCPGSQVAKAEESGNIFDRSSQAQSKPKMPEGPSAIDAWLKPPFGQPGELTDADRARYAFATFVGSGSEEVPPYKTTKLKSCDHSAKTIEMTTVRLTARDRDVCANRQKEVVWLASTQGLYVCEAGGVRMAMKTSIGSAGFGKEREGDDKTPIGRYWLGVPRLSERYGLFIHIGYPNAQDVALKRTGKDVGIHSTRHFWPFKACNAQGYISENWTQGCVAVARDEQIKELADWVMASWPVEIELIDDVTKPKAAAAAL